MTRVEPRVAALEALYAAEAVGADEVVLTGLASRARDLATGTWTVRSDLDGEISGAAKGWRIERMPAVDRNILRLAVYELRHTKTPVGVVISEAVKLAKRYSTTRSGGYVNGILGTLADRETGRSDNEGAD